MRRAELRRRLAKSLKSFVIRLRPIRVAQLRFCKVILHDSQSDLFLVSKPEAFDLGAGPGLAGRREEQVD